MRPKTSEVSEIRLRDFRSIDKQNLKGRKYGHTWLYIATEEERRDFVLGQKTSQPSESAVAKSMAACFHGNYYLAGELLDCLYPNDKRQADYDDYDRLARHVLSTSRPWDSELLWGRGEVKQADSEWGYLQLVEANSSFIPLLREACPRYFTPHQPIDYGFCERQGA